MKEEDRMAGAKPKQIHPRRVIIDPITRIEGHMKSFNLKRSGIARR